LIEVRDLVKKYAGVTAVDRISFAVEQGEIVGFLGKNGAGKSTTMKILSCFFPPTSGVARVAGYDCVTDSLEVRRRIGYMPENVPLYHDMRVAEYLTFRSKLKGVGRRERGKAIDDVVAACGLKEVKRKLIGSLSKGYRQRTGLAEAIVHKPALLILDEPTVGLDPNQIVQVRGMIKDLGTRMTILLSSHILREVELTTTRILMIHRGRLVANGTPGSLIGGMQAPRRFAVEARGPEEAVAAALRGIPGVTSAEKRGEPGAEGWQAWTVETPQERDARVEIAQAVGAGGWELRELREERRTLEDLFVQITTTDEAPRDLRPKGPPAAGEGVPA
jgi:ABC-2 type transport system ATP-binding protein